METKKKKVFYVRPQTEVYGLESRSSLLNNSFLGGGHDDGWDDGLVGDTQSLFNGGHDNGGNDGLVSGAKSFHFTFRNPWESSD